MMNEERRSWWTTRPFSLFLLKCTHNSQSGPHASNWADFASLVNENDSHLKSKLCQFLPRCMECRRGLTMRIMSVRLSVRQTRVLWQNGRKICPDFYTIRKIIWPNFLKRKMVGRGDPFYLKFWVNRPALERNRRFKQIFASSASAVTLSEKSSINTNRKSTTLFPMSLRRLSYVAPKSPKGGSKTQNGRFPSKIALRLKKVCLFKLSATKLYRAFIGLTNHAKMTGGGDLSYLKFWVNLTALERNRRFVSIFASSTSAITPSEKVQLTLISSPLRTPVRSPTQRVAQKRSVQNLNNKLR